MKTAIPRKIIGLTILLFLFSQCTPSYDWPGWRGPNRDGVVKGFQVPAEWPEQPELKWQKRVGLGNSSPVLVDNELFLFVLRDSNEVMLCLNPKSGDQIWETSLNKAPEVTGGASSHPGPRSTPAIADGRIFALGAGGILSCLKKDDGTMLWQNKDYDGQVPRFFTSASPLIVDNLCIIHMGGQENGTILALEAERGNVVWEYRNQPCTYSSAVLMEENQLVVQAESTLLGLSLGGDLLWSISTPNERRFYSSATPIVHREQLFVTGQGNGTKSYEISKENGSHTAKLIWSNEDLGTTFNTPVLKNGYLFGNEAKYGSIFCINANSGETCWADTSKHNRFASTLDLGEVMLSLSSNRELVFYEPTGASYRELAKYTLADSDIYAHPLVLKNTLYIKDETNLICWSFE